MRRRTHDRARTCALVTAALATTALALAGCGKGGSRPPAWNHPEVELRWPEQPATARIRYSGLLRSASDLGRGKSVADRLLGARSTKMVRPTAVARSAAGTLVVADPGVPTIHYFYLDQRDYHRLDEAYEAQLEAPVGVAIDDQERVYVADSGRGVVLLFDRGRKLVRELGKGLLQRPTGVALSPDQRTLYVIDAAANRILVHGPDDSWRSFGTLGADPGELYAPTHVAVAPDGSLSVTDSLNFRVQRFAPDGSYLGAIGQPGDGAGHFSRPKGVAIDRHGRHYVVDAAFENIQVFAQDGTLLLAFGEPGHGPGEFSLPNGLFIDSGGLLWLADAYNERLQAFQLLEAVDAK